jgi:CRISPR system Cascade subunit CasE
MTERWPAGYVLKMEGDLDLAFTGIGENPAIRRVNVERAAIQAGRRFVFRLRANTTKKIDTKSGPNSVRRHGRHVPVRGDDERMAWFTRHADAAGFAVDGGNVRMIEIRAMGGRGAKSVTVAGALFEGVLVVGDADRFRAALEAGIGPAKAYGFGLLSIAPEPNEGSALLPR